MEFELIEGPTTREDGVVFEAYQGAFNSQTVFRTLFYRTDLLVTIYYSWEVWEVGLFRALLLDALECVESHMV